MLRVLQQGLPLTDAQPVWIYQESERATVPDPPSSLDNAVAPTQTLYGWPVHQLWEAHEEALLAKIYKAMIEPGARRQQAKITKEKARSSVDYLRIPAVCPVNPCKLRPRLSLSVTRMPPKR